MARFTDNMLRRLWGTSDARAIGVERTLRGLREGEPRDIYLGLAVSAFAYLRRTKPRKQLIYRQEVSEGSAVVIHHKKSGTPRLEIVRPPKRRRKGNQTL